MLHATVQTTKKLYFICDWMDRIYIILYGYKNLESAFPKEFKGSNLKKL